MYFNHSAALSPEGSVAFRGAHFGEGSGPIFLERYDCEEGDQRFLDCAAPPIGVHDCDHSSDVGVQCIGQTIYWVALNFSNLLFRCRLR